MRRAGAAQTGDFRLAGLLAAAVALGMLFACSSLVAGAPFAPTAAAARLVRLVPGDVATAFIELLGKLALRAVTAAAVVVSLWLGAVALERLRSPWRTGLVLFAAAAAGALADPSAKAAPGPVVIVSAGSGALYATTGRILLAMLSTDAEADRRRALRLGVGGALGIALAGGMLGWLTRRLSGPDTDVPIAAPVTPAGVPDRPHWPGIPGQTPEITSARDHYVVDINLVAPSVEARDWKLDVLGLVERPSTLRFADLQKDFAVVEEYSVLTCISNPVGGPLVGHSAWRGVRLADVLKRAGVKPGAVDVVLRASDGYSESIPMGVAMDPRVLVAFAQNGEPLSQEHGFPCRLRVPRIFGMKNVKWLQSVEVVGDDYRGYWQKRGWSDDATVLTQSRIDVAGDDGRARVGEPTWVAGVAWAGDRGVAQVEVSTDGGRTWRAAALREPVGDLSWRLWALRWTPDRPGRAEIRCRATDGEGCVQPAAETRPHPSGAAGHHSKVVDVL